MSAKLKEFEEWLASRLRDLNADDAVFGPYISSLLEDNEDLEDQEEALESLLGELVGPTESKAFADEIFTQWRKATGTSGQPASGESTSSTLLNSNSNGQIQQSDMDKQFDQILRLAAESIEEQASSRLESGKGLSSSQQAMGQPDSQLRAKILSQMNNESESESEDESGLPGPSKKKSSESSLPSDVGRAANLSKVLTEQKEDRDRARENAAKKREKDKEDRAKQKAANQDRKEKAKKKAAKVERKR